MIYSDRASSGTSFGVALLFVGIFATLAWIGPWVLFADLEGWPSNDDPFYAKPLAIWVEQGEFIVVPRGVEHRPFAEDEVWVLLFEPASTLNTGNVQDERTVSTPAWI